MNSQYQKHPSQLQSSMSFSNQQQPAQLAQQTQQYHPGQPLYPEQQQQQYVPSYQTHQSQINYNPQIATMPYQQANYQQMGIPHQYHQAAFHNSSEQYQQSAPSHFPAQEPYQERSPINFQANRNQSQEEYHRQNYQAQDGYLYGKYFQQNQSQNQFQNQYQNQFQSQSKHQQRAQKPYPQPKKQWKTQNKNRQQYQQQNQYNQNFHQYNNQESMHQGKNRNYNFQDYQHYQKQEKRQSHYNNQKKYYQNKNYEQSYNQENQERSSSDSQSYESFYERKGKANQNNFNHSDLQKNQQKQSQNQNQSQAHNEFNPQQEQEHSNTSDPNNKIQSSNNNETQNRSNNPSISPKSKKQIQNQKIQTNQTNHLSAQATKKLFVGGLPPFVDETLLKNFFEKYGKLRDCQVVYYNNYNQSQQSNSITHKSSNKKAQLTENSGSINNQSDQLDRNPSIQSCSVNKKSRGFGWVSFYDDQLYDQLVNKDLMAFGRMIQIKGQEDSQQKEKRTEFLRLRKLFVGALNPLIKEKDLFNAFWKFGEILEVNIQLNTKSKSRCFGYVLFKYPYTLKQVLLYNQNHSIKVQGKVVDIKPARMKGESTVNFEFLNHPVFDDLQDEKDPFMRNLVDQYESTKREYESDQQLQEDQKNEKKQPEKSNFKNEKSQLRQKSVINQKNFQQISRPEFEGLADFEHNNQQKQESDQELNQIDQDVQDVQEHQNKQDSPFSKTRKFEFIQTGDINNIDTNQIPLQKEDTPQQQSSYEHPYLKYINENQQDSSSSLITDSQASNLSKLLIPNKQNKQKKTPQVHQIDNQELNLKQSLSYKIQTNKDSFQVKSPSFKKNSQPIGNKEQLNYIQKHAEQYKEKSKYALDQIQSQVSFNRLSSNKNIQNNFQNQDQYRKQSIEHTIDNSQIDLRSESNINQLIQTREGLAMLQRQFHDQNVAYQYMQFQKGNRELSQSEVESISYQDSYLTEQKIALQNALKQHPSHQMNQACNNNYQVLPQDNNGHGLMNAFVTQDGGQESFQQSQDQDYQQLNTNKTPFDDDEQLSEQFIDQKIGQQNYEDKEMLNQYSLWPQQQQAGNSSQYDYLHQQFNYLGDRNNNIPTTQNQQQNYFQEMQQRSNLDNQIELRNLGQNTNQVQEIARLLPYLEQQQLSTYQKNGEFYQTVPNQEIQQLGSQMQAQQLQDNQQDIQNQIQQDREQQNQEGRPDTPFQDFQEMQDLQRATDFLPPDINAQQQSQQNFNQQTGKIGLQLKRSNTGSSFDDLMMEINTKFKNNSSSKKQQ